MPSFGTLTSLGYSLPCASCFFFVRLLLSSDLQFIKMFSGQPGLDIHSTATNLGQTPGAHSNGQTGSPGLLGLERGCHDAHPLSSQKTVTSMQLLSSPSMLSPRPGDACLLLAARKEGANFCSSNSKTKESQLSFLLRMETAVSSLQRRLKDHQTTRFLATPAGNGGMKAQIPGAHLDLPEWGRTEGCIQKGHGGACMSFAGEPSPGQGGRR